MNAEEIKKEEIISFLYGIVEEHNKINPEELQLMKSLDTELVGLNGRLDSLGLINFLVEVESNLNKKYQSNICIIDEILLLDQEGPYKNLENLCEYILEKIK